MSICALEIDDAQGESRRGGVGHRSPSQDESHWKTSVDDYVYLPQTRFCGKRDEIFISEGPKSEVRDQRSELRV